MRIGRDARNAYTILKDHVTTQQEGSHLKAKERSLRINQPYQHSDLDLPATIVRKIKFNAVITYDLDGLQGPWFCLYLHVICCFYLIFHTFLQFLHMPSQFSPQGIWICHTFFQGCSFFNIHDTFPYFIQFFTQVPPCQGALTHPPGLPWMKNKTTKTWSAWGGKVLLKGEGPRASLSRGFY